MGWPKKETKSSGVETPPDPVVFLVHAAALQLVYFEALADACRRSSESVRKNRLADAATLVLRRREQVAAELRGLGADPGVTFLLADEWLSRVQRISDLDDECERLLGVYVVQGIIDDALLECAVAMPGDSGARMREVLAVSSASVVIEAELQAVLAEHPERKNRCALWGRSLVGDALLIVRSLRGAVSAPDATVQGFTHVITRHSQRMDALGLTA